MSKRSKLRPISDWYVRNIDGVNFLVGWEVYADRPICAEIVSRGNEQYKGMMRPLYECHDRRYIATGLAAPARMWRLKNATTKS